MNNACKEIRFCFQAEKWIDENLVCNQEMCARDFNQKVMAVYQKTPNNYLKDRIKEHFKF